MTDSPGSAHRTVSPGLLGTLRGFLFAAAALAVGAAIAASNYANAISRWDEGGITAGRLLDAEELHGALLGLLGLCMMVIAILIIIWWYQAYTAIARTGAGGRSWSPGWAIGGWFIPVANFIIPKLVLNEIDRVGAAAEEGSGDWRTRPLHMPAHAWWAFYIAGAVLFFVGTSITAEQLEQPIAIETYRTGVWITAVGCAALFPASLFAASSLKVIGGRLSR